jgi:hypothetical protein
VRNLNLFVGKTLRETLVDLSGRPAIIDYFSAVSLRPLNTGDKEIQEERCAINVLMDSKHSIAQRARARVASY